MILCSCSGLTDHEVKKAYDRGAKTTAQVYKQAGRRPNCGRCVESIREVMSAQEALDYSLARSA